MSTVYAAYDYKYADREWRVDAEESFALMKQVTTTYNSTAGQITRVREETKEFASAPALAPADPLTSPPYLYADSSWHRDAAFSFQPTLIRTTDYQAQGLDSYATTVTTLHPLTGETETETSLTGGNLPIIPTVNTALTSLVVQPIIGTLSDECLEEFAESTKSIDLPWAETKEQVDAAARRVAQRDSALVRVIKMAANPTIRIGQTVRLIDPKRDIDALHLVTGRTITREAESGDCSMVLTLEFWVR